MGPIEISEYYKDDSTVSKAVVLKNSTGYFIEYYDDDGIMFHTETFTGKSLHYVEDAAENWVLGIKKL
jgi:hypothetical protein